MVRGTDGCEKKGMYVYRIAEQRLLRGVIPKYRIFTVTASAGVPVEAFD